MPGPELGKQMPMFRPVSAAPAAPAQFAPPEFGRPPAEAAWARVNDLLDKEAS